MTAHKDQLAKVMADVPDRNGNTMMYESDANRVLDAILATAETRQAMRHLLNMASNNDPTSGDAS